jgi:hypothetical protein
MGTASGIVVLDAEIIDNRAAFLIIRWGENPR